MKRANYHFLIITIISITLLFLIPGCVPELADINPPVVEIVHPLADATVNGIVEVVVSASDDNDIKAVTIYIDGKKVFTSANSVVVYSWDTAPIADNLQHYVSAVASDNSDNVGTAPGVTVTVVGGQNADITPPIVSILNPVNNQVVSGNVNIVAEASDNVEVDRVEFYIDGLLETTVNDRPFDYLWNTTPVNLGLHTIFARAYDTSNNTSASPTISVTVDSTSNDSPSAPSNAGTATATLAMGNVFAKVSIINPNRNGIFFSETETNQIPIEVKTVNGATLKAVEFYIDGNLQKVITQPISDRLTYNWDIEGFGDGLVHTIFVKGIDEFSNSTADMVVVRVYP